MLGITLERLFRAPGQIAVLRVLWKAPAPLTGRQVQRLAGVHNLTAMKSLEALEELGLLQRRAAGRAYLYWLKRSHRVVRDMVGPVFEAERRGVSRLKSELAGLLKSECLAAILYGSAARGEAGPGSDVDLLVVVSDRESAASFARGPQARAERLVREHWSLPLEVSLRTVAEVAGTWNTPLMKRIRREGQNVVGENLKEVRGWHPRAKRGRSRRRRPATT